MQGVKEVLHAPLRVAVCAWLGRRLEMRALSRGERRGLPRGQVLGRSVYGCVRFALVYALADEGELAGSGEESWPPILAGGGMTPPQASPWRRSLQTTELRQGSNGWAGLKFDPLAEPEACAEGMLAGLGRSVSVGAVFAQSGPGTCKADAGVLCQQLPPNTTSITLLNVR